MAVYTEVSDHELAEFLAAYHRDLTTGGLFVPTKNPAALSEVEALVNGSPAQDG